LGFILSHRKRKANPHTNPAKKRDQFYPRRRTAVIQVAAIKSLPYIYSNSAY